MIKLEDNVSVVIICVITFMAIFYSFMFLGDNFAAAFMERTGNPAPNEATLFWMGSWGFIYLSLAVGNKGKESHCTEVNSTFARWNQ
jgi:hypothetical protein